MKKFIFSAAVALIMSGAAIAGYAYYQQSQIDPAILENIEALSGDEGVKFWFNDQYWEGVAGNGSGNWYPQLSRCSKEGIDGKAVVCAPGTGNCWNGTSCIRGA